MGSRSSRNDDKQPLLADVDEEPILEKLTILLMGQHEARKNTVGNAILCKNAFKYKHRRKRCYCKKENTILGRNVTLIRVPGWSEDLSSEKNKERFQVIKDSVLSVKGGPHVLILVGSFNTELTKTTKKLKEILGGNVDQHILPLSVEAKLIVIEHRDERKTIIDRCRNHFFRCKCRFQSQKLLETIENFILHKHEICFYHTGRRAPTPESKYQDLKNLVEGLCFHITTLQVNAVENEAKLQELQHLLKEKNEMLKMLTANSSDNNLLHEKIDQLQQQINQEKKKSKELKEENEALKNENLKRNKTPTAVKRNKTPNHVDTYSAGSEELIPLSELRETSYNEDPQSGKSHSQEFLKKHRTKLIEQVVSCQPIADQLLPFIGDHKYSLIQQASTRNAKMRRIFDIVMNGGKRLQDEFYRILQKEEKYLLEDLQSSND